MIQVTVVVEAAVMVHFRCCSSASLCSFSDDGEITPSPDPLLHHLLYQVPAPALLKLGPLMRADDDQLWSDEAQLIEQSREPRDLQEVKGKTADDQIVDALYERPCLDLLKADRLCPSPCTS